MQADEKLTGGVDYGRFRTIVDIGDNRGAFLTRILHHYPTIQHGFVFDLPHVINQCKKGEDLTSGEISQDRRSFISGDMFDPSTIPIADAYLLKYILHNSNDEKCLEILSSIGQVNLHKQDSPRTIFIFEHILLSDGKLSSWQSYGTDIVMTAMFADALERTESEHKELLEKSGFEMKKFHPLQAPLSIIEAILIV